MNRLLSFLPSRIIDRRNDRLVFELILTIMLKGCRDVEHEALRVSLGWSAHRFDAITDMAINIGYIDYRVDFDAPATPGAPHEVLYYLTALGRAVFYTPRDGS